MQRAESGSISKEHVHCPQDVLLSKQIRGQYALRMATLSFGGFIATSARSHD